VTLRIGAETRQVDDRQLGRESVECRTLRADQQIADEKRVPGIFSDDPRRQGVGRIGTANQVLNEQFLAAGVRQHIFAQGCEVLRLHGLVVVPPDLRLGDGVTNHELVLRRTPGVLAGDRPQRALCGQLRLAAAQRLLVELGLDQIVIDVL